MLAPIVRGRKGEFKKEIAGLRGRGFTKARIDGQFRSLEDDPKLDRRRNHTIEVVVLSLVEQDLLVKLADLAVDACTDKSVLVQFL